MIRKTNLLLLISLIVMFLCSSTVYALTEMQYFYLQWLFQQGWDEEMVVDGLDKKPTESGQSVPEAGMGAPSCESETPELYQQSAQDLIGPTGSIDCFIIAYPVVDTPSSEELSFLGKIFGSTVFDDEVDLNKPKKVPCRIEYDPETGETRIFVNGDAVGDYDHVFKMLEIEIDGQRVSIRKGNGNKYFQLHKPGEEDETLGKITYKVNVSYQNIIDLTPKASASIGSDYYDVSEAIPTSEITKASASAKSALYQIQVRKLTYEASCTDVPVEAYVEYGHYNKSGKWISEGHVTKSDTFTYSTKKEYYDVPISQIFLLAGGSASAKHETGATVGAVSVGGSSLSEAAPKVNNYLDKRKEVVKFSRIGERCENKYAATQEANSLLSYVKDDLKKTMDEGIIPEGGNITYEWNGLKVDRGGVHGSPIEKYESGSNSGPIPTDYPNGTYNGKGSAGWAAGFSCGMTPNKVEVHTPVVNQTNVITSDKFINQKINKDRNMTYLQLDKGFSVEIKDEGVHINKKGYSLNGESKNYNSKAGFDTGNNDSNWAKMYDFKFDFDVYLKYDITSSSYKTYLLKAGKWMSEIEDAEVLTKINFAKTKQNFLVPVWVTEGEHHIYTRAIAENAMTPEQVEVAGEGANLDKTQYSATKDNTVEILGKIYDLQVSKTNDVDWSQIQGSKYYNHDYVSASEFPFGNTYSNGSSVRSQNKNSQYRNAPKLGYTITFNFKTKGRKSSAIQIDVTKFSFLSKEDGSVKEVDLYYKPQATGLFIKIGENGNLKVKPNSMYLGVPMQAMVSSGIVYPIEKGVEMYKKWIPSTVPYNYANDVLVGKFTKLIVPHGLRFVYDNFAEYIPSSTSKGLYARTRAEIEQDAMLEENGRIVENGSNRVTGSVGRWYVGYVLPSSTVAVPKGTNPNTSPDKILKHGYILVSFGIKSLDISTGNSDYLLYHGPEYPEDVGIQDKPEIDWTLDTKHKTPIQGVPGNPDGVPLDPDVVAMIESDYSVIIDAVTGMGY